MEYRKLSAAIAYDHVGGLAVPWYDGLTDTFRFSSSAAWSGADDCWSSRHLTLMSTTQSEFDGLVLGPGASRLSRDVDDWTERGRARVEARIGSLAANRQALASPGPLSPYRLPLIARIGQRTRATQRARSSDLSGSRVDVSDRHVPVGRRDLDRRSSSARMVSR